MLHRSPSQTLPVRCIALTLLVLFLVLSPQVPAWAMPANIARGQHLPDATLVGGTHHATVHLDELKGRVKILSIVPQLNTPVCDEQTHQFSENKEGANPDLEIVTISTNTHDDQTVFADKAGIDNITFLSDAPHFDFGNKTGLLYPGRRILQRAVMVVDADNVVRYLEIVPMGQLPNIAAAMDAARGLLSLTSLALPARNGFPQQGEPHGDPSDSMVPPPGIIGVALHLTAEYVGGPAGLFIRATHPMGPAVKAGLTHGQEILAVDGHTIKGKTYREVVAMIRGEVGTPVTLLVKHLTAVKEVKIVRVSEDSVLHTDDKDVTHPGKRHS